MTNTDLREKFEAVATEELPRIITAARNRGAEAALKMFESALVSAYNAGVEASANALPTNWVDSLLTGKPGIKIPAGEPEVETLIHGIKARIAALKLPGAP